MKRFRYLGNRELVFGGGAIGTVADFAAGAAGAGAAGSAGGGAETPRARAGSKGAVLVITGEHFRSSEACDALLKSFRDRDIPCRVESWRGEPTADAVDSLADAALGCRASLVAAVGGGSILDLGKAAAATARQERAGVRRYLEGVGEEAPTGNTIPMIAVPTTAGTGSEATKNAVIKGEWKGSCYKKSLRHDAFVPAAAVIDPDLAVGCPPEVSLACGMDAFCQLLESYVSTGAGPITDALARDGIRRFARGSRLFTDNLYGSPEEAELRGELALAAYYSGLTLANAGLGTVHGLAGPLGAVCDIPHGAACALLMPPVFRRLADRLDELEDGGNVRRRLAWAGSVLPAGEGDPKGAPWRDSRPSLGAGGAPPNPEGKIGGAANPLSGAPGAPNAPAPDARNSIPPRKLNPGAPQNSRTPIEKLLQLLENWSRQLPRLASYGLEHNHVDTVVQASGNKNFPLPLDESERRRILQELL